jgi:hypothetical protein
MKNLNELKKHSQRLQILNRDEIAALYAVPQFNAAERSHYFSLPENVHRSLKIMKSNGRNTSAKLWFILQYGYFRAKHQFFNVTYSDVKEDVLFIMTHYLVNDGVPIYLPSRRIQGLVKSQVLQEMGYRDDTARSAQLIAEKVDHLAKITHSVTDIFSETIRYLESEKTVLPSYSHLQDGIGAALKVEDQRLIKQKYHALKGQPNKKMCIGCHA